MELLEFIGLPRAANEISYTFVLFGAKFAPVVNFYLVVLGIGSKRCIVESTFKHKSLLVLNDLGKSGLYFFDYNSELNLTWSTFILLLYKA